MMYFTLYIFTIISILNLTTDYYKSYNNERYQQKNYKSYNNKNVSNYIQLNAIINPWLVQKRLLPCSRWPRAALEV